MIRVWASTCFLVAISTPALSQALVPTGIVLDSSGNGILEPGEGVPVYPYWQNPGPIFLVGGAATLSNFTGPAGATYTIVDGTAFYGDFGPGYPPPGYPPHTCHPVDCYAPVALRITAATRPVQHWDATVLEGLWMGTITKNWTLHVGATFADVPPTSGFYRFVETIVHKRRHRGLLADGLLPHRAGDAPGHGRLPPRRARAERLRPAAVRRDAALRTYPYPAPSAAGSKEIARRGIAGGCGDENYCPAAPVSRQEMAVFLLAGGTTPSPVLGAPFLDVPVSSPFCPWIRDLVAMGVTAGCGNGNYCPTAPVTREQMSVFLTTRFGLVLYGV